jgi:hydroxymethylpyrimidine/phosphomethylpyrimidine kinase
MTPNKIILTIAGSDSSGGAGIQADIKTFSALETYAASVITAVTAQNTRSVTNVVELPEHNIDAQLHCVFADLDIAAVKIGMIASPKVMSIIRQHLASKTIPVVLDPVMISKSGYPLLAPDACSTLKEVLIPCATLLMPNAPEAACLLNTEEATTTAALLVQGQQILELGVDAVVMKGGHLEGAVCTDILLQKGQQPLFLSQPRIRTQNTHGTGCTYSSAIAAYLGKGYAMQEAVQSAHGYLHQAIAQADSLRVGHGHGPTHHFHALWSTS